MSREEERSKLEERITVAEQKEKLYADQMKILHREKTGLDRKKRNHRLFTRGAMLESFLKEPLKLTDGDISYLLEIMFRSSFSQSKLAELIAARKPSNSVQTEETDDSGIMSEESHEL